VCSTERKYPTDKPWAFISPSAARTAQRLPYKSDTYFSNDAKPVINRRFCWLWGVIEPCQPISFLNVKPCGWISS